MTKVTDKIRDLVDPQHKGFRHTLLFKILIGLALLILLGIIYNVFIRRSTTADMTDDEKDAEAARKASLDTLDVVGDYLWPDVKPAKDTTTDKKEEVDKPVEHVKEQPVAEAATEEDIENATGENSDNTEQTTTTEPAAEKKQDVPKVEKMDKPTVEEIE